MQLFCNLCNQALKDGEEVQYSATSFFKLLKSAVIYSVSAPHDLDPASFVHIDCKGYYGNDRMS
jgi:hypothetical protein